jgi:aspartate racemase
MQTIGLIAGMSWESSVEYYRIFNETVRERLGGLHSAQCLIYSVDFAEIEVLQRENRWEEAGLEMAAAAQRLERGGAGLIVLGTNTMHISTDVIQNSVSIPFLHIVDPTAERICAQGFHTIGLLGTRFTMEKDFYVGRLKSKYGLNVLVPENEERELVHRVIYDELCLGQVCEPSRQRYREIIARLVARGAQGIILGCTEIGLLVKPEDSSVPLFDTTRLHAEAAVDWALGGRQ